jgi:hypothetical protein
MQSTSRQATLAAESNVNPADKELQSAEINCNLWCVPQE